MNIIKIGIIVLIASIIIPINSIYSQESETIQVEVKYTNGDIVDFYGMSLVVYQDFSNTPIIKKEMKSNPDIILLPKDHKYKIEIYANGMYGDVGYVDLKNNSEKININIPISGGLQFNIFYKDGQTPIKGATISIKSQDGTQWRVGKTNDQGNTIRYWIQSTTRYEDYYIADVSLGDIELTTLSQIKLLPGLTKDQKIIVPIPAIINDLITVTLYKTEFEKITKNDGDFSVLLKDDVGNIIKQSQVNNRGEAYFSSIPTKEYTLFVLKNGIADNSWDTQKVVMIGQENNFKIVKSTQPTIIPKTENTSTKNDESVSSCNCVAFRFDDVQDYWLNDVQSAYVNTFVEKNIPLTVGIIADSFGNDQKITEIIKEAANKNKIEIASQGVGNKPFTDFSKKEQDDLLKQSISDILNSVGVRTQIFIPPQNRYNNDTQQILIENKFTHISSNRSLEELPPPFSLKGETLYRFPQTATTGKYSVEQNLFVGVSSGDTYVDTINSLKKYGFAVITSHPQEFAIIQNGTYVNQINEEQIHELELLIQKLQSDGIRIVNVGKINLDSSDTVIPQWIKNNAGWWAQGSIEDNSFVQGIQYLIKNEIIKIPKTTDESDTKNTVIPQWIKNNAGWWAQGQITDSDFVQGIQYMINNKILTY
ncbi:MAG TPA: polysaccharide deacetylase family protein [Nitrosarchaeum sp.]|nr:polysaccharide deacetylase family protein [Nitrosarchaeum sp.]